MEILPKTKLSWNAKFVIGCCIIAALWVSWVVYDNYFKPKEAPAVIRVVPTVTPTDYYYFLENPADYYAGRCAIAPKEAIPEYYAAHPGMVQCRFKTTVAP